MSKKRTDVKESEKPILLSRKKLKFQTKQQKRKQNKQKQFFKLYSKNKNKQISNDYNCLSKTNKRKKLTRTKQFPGKECDQSESSVNVRAAPVFSLYTQLHTYSPFILLFPSLPLTSRIPAETIRSVLQSFRFIFVHQPVVGCKVGCPLTLRKFD